MPYMYNMWSEPYDLAISIAEGQTVTSGGTEVTSFTVDPTPTGKETNADVWEEHEGTFGGIDYKYATFTPETPSKGLFVWLHGVGEGFSGELGADVTWDETEEHGHEWRFWDLEVEKFLAWLPRTDSYAAAGPRSV